MCAESWEMSAHPDGMSEVAQGPFSGKTLGELVTAFGTALIGTLAPNPHQFPLIVKLIDARRCLSVQVHPNNANAALTRGEPKTEMWYMLGGSLDASLYAGLAEGVTPESLRGALAQHTVESQLVRLPVSAGLALLIPGGLVHAIGAGCLIYEVQQSSNTTYRLFDWERTGTDGNPRPLHIDESLKSIDWSLPARRLLTPVEIGGGGKNRWSGIVGCPYFRMRKLDLLEPIRLAPDNTTFHALFATDGQVILTAGGERITLTAGSSALVPASANTYELSPETPSTLLLTTL